MFNLKEIFEVSLRKIPYMQVKGFGPTVGLYAGDSPDESIVIHYDIGSRSVSYLCIDGIQVYTGDLKDSLSYMEIEIKESLERAVEDRISEHVACILNSMD